MARVLVLGVKVPFTEGGQDVLVRTLISELKRRGHEADVVEIPFQVQPKEELPRQAALWRALDLSQFGGLPVDLVIATKFPSYYAKHPKKSLWLVHQHREMYDLYGSRYSDFSDDPRDEALRRMLVSGDEQVLGECSYLSAISGNVTTRLKNYNHLSAETLYPPLPLGNRYQNGEYGDYVLVVGRICAIKRVDMMVKALPFVHSHVKLKIVGTPDVAGIMDYLNNEIDKHHLWGRVEFLGRVSDDALVDLYSKALCVYYAPHNEDYGYVTLEGMASGRPIITATDSGGVLEFVRDNETGFIAEPTSESIGKAINRLVEDGTLPRKLGTAGRAFIDGSGLLEQGWDTVIQKLLSPLQQ